MEFEFYRNNARYTASIEHPLVFTGETKIEKGGGSLSPIAVFENKVYAASGTYLVCFDLNTKAVIWERESGTEISTPIDGGNDRIYLNVDTRTTCISAETGETVWGFGGEEYPLAASEDGLYCVDIGSEPEPLICRKKETGEKQWVFDAPRWYPSIIAIEKELLIIKGGEGLHVCRTDTGEIHLDIEIKNMFQKEFPQRNFRTWRLGPLIDGTLFFGFDGYDGGENGLLFAVKANSGEILWTLELDTKACPRTIIHKDDKLFFDLNQVGSSPNFIYTVNSKTGELLFKSDESITASGCANPIMIDKYFIGGMGQYLSFFDIEKQEFVWRYKHKKRKSVFGGKLVVSGDHLLTYDNSENEIYWFESRA